jgi:ubiquinone/menaquinone biosynthesis C-methylase UbiE
MNIGRFAPWYRWVEYAAFGRGLERSRFVFLHRLAGARRLLVPGEGDGRTLARLLEVAPHAEIDIVEVSGAMIELARQRAADSPRVRFHQADALTASLSDAFYDGVVTLFFFDCFSEAELRGLIRKIARAMTPDAVWIVSEFALPERGWRRRHAAIWIWAMYRFFGAVSGLRQRTLPPIARLLTEAGFERRERQAARWGLICSEVWIRPKQQ